MTADYCSWFLKNFRNYNYYGDEAQNIKRRLTRIAERLTPPKEAEIVELYSAFYRLYNADVFSDKSSSYPGIRPKTGDYFLIFSIDKTPVPMAYLSEKTVVSENDIRDAVANEKERKLKYLQDVTDYQIKRRGVVKSMLEEAKEKFSASGSGITTGVFIFFAIIFFVGGFLLFAEKIYDFLFLDNAMRITVLSLSVVSAILFLVLAFISNKKYSYYNNSKGILDKMSELQEKIDDNVGKIKQCNTQGIRLAIRNGKAIKPLFFDTDYSIQLRYFETSVQLLNLRLTAPTKTASALFFFATTTMGYALSIVAMSFMCHYEYGEQNYIAAGVVTAVIGLFAILFSKKVRVHRVLLLAIISAGLSCLYMYCF